MNILLPEFAKGVHTSLSIRRSSLMTKFGLAGEDWGRLFSLKYGAL